MRWRWRRPPVRTPDRSPTSWPRLPRERTQRRGAAGGRRGGGLGVGAGGPGHGLPPRRRPDRPVPGVARAWREPVAPEHYQRHLHRPVPLRVAEAAGEPRTALIGPARPAGLLGRQAEDLLGDRLEREFGFDPATETFPGFAAPLSCATWRLAHPSTDEPDRILRPALRALTAPGSGRPGSTPLTTSTPTGSTAPAGRTGPARSSRTGTASPRRSGGAAHRAARRTGAAPRPGRPGAPGCAQERTRLPGGTPHSFGVWESSRWSQNQ